MNAWDIDRRLKAADPASPAPAELSLMVDAVIAQSKASCRRHRSRRLRPALITGGVLLAAGALVAATNIDAILLSTPPFSTLGAGESRVMDGLSYSPLEGVDRGEQCKLYIDLAGLTDEQFTETRHYWSSADPSAFAAGVKNRLDDYPGLVNDAASDTIEWQAVTDEILARLAPIVPGVAWGTASPGDAFEAGEPHLSTVSRVCDDDLEGLGYSE